METVNDSLETVIDSLETAFFFRNCKLRNCIFYDARKSSARWVFTFELAPLKIITISSLGLNVVVHTHSGIQFYSVLSVFLSVAHSAHLSISNLPLELLLIHISRLIFSARSLTTSFLIMVHGRMLPSACPTNFADIGYGNSPSLVDSKLVFWST